MSLAEITQHLEAAFGVYKGTEYDDGVFEITSSVNAEELAPKIAKHFALDQIPEAAEYALRRSEAGCNVYTVPALLFGVDGRRSTQADFYATKYVIADVDERWSRSLAASKGCGLAYKLGVRTATKPEARVQVWYELDEITEDLDDIREAAPALTAALCADAQSIDTGTHLFRLAGTTNFPTVDKQAEGRVPEHIEIKVHDVAPVNVHTLSRLQPHAEYQGMAAGRVGKGGPDVGIERDENNKVINGREMYWRSMVLAAIRGFQEANGADPTADDIFADCFPTFKDSTAGDDRWTSANGQKALKQRVHNTLKRIRSGRLATHGMYSIETGIGREEAEQKAAERVEAEFRENDGSSVQPFDLFGKFDPPVFPRGILPPVLDDLAFTMGQTMGCDPAGIAMGALGVCAAAIPDEVKLKVKVHEDWAERACLWPALIGTPSTKKSPMLDMVAKPLMKINAQLVAEHKELLEQWENLDKETRGDKPKSKRKVVDDATSEALQDVLENNSSGLLCLQDELSGLFGRIEKYGGKGGGADRAFWLRLYNGGQYSVDRVNRGSFTIENASVVLVGGIQPDRLLELASGTADDGMLQRITPVFLSRATVGRDEPIPDVVGRYNQLVTDLAGHGTGFMGYSYIRFSNDAQAYRAELEKKNVDLMSVDTFNTKLSARFGKYDGLFARLCVIFHCIETVGGNIRSEVSLDTAERAGRLLYEYILRNDLSFYSGLLGMADNHDLVKDVAGYILARGLTSVSYRDLHRTSKQLKKTDHVTARRLFEQLSALGWGTVSEAKNMTAPPKFTVNPEVHRLFAERAETERAQREATVALMNELAGQKQ